MSPSHRLLPGLALAVLAACTTASSDDPSDAVESDVTRVPGSSIGSAHVDPAKTYLRRRNVRNLYSTTTLDREAIDVAERVDGVIANKPKDGFVSIDELVAMEKPPQSTVLFPNEKAALPRIWAVMEIGAVAPVVNLVGAPAGDLPLKDRITTKLTPPSPIVVTKMPVASLSYDLRTVASRIELAYDDDADPATISPADVASAKANPAPFTSSEVALMDRIAAEQRARGTSTASAKLVLPYDGVLDERYGKAGPFEIVRSRRLVLEETRSLKGSTIDVQLDAEETVRDRLLVDGTEAIVAFFSTTTDDEYVVGPLLGDDITRIPAGRYVAQVWRRPGLGPFAREGAPCATDNQLFESTCGKCGYAKSVCVGGKVTAYGACVDQSPTCSAGGAPPKTLVGWFEIELGDNHPPAYVPDWQRTVKLRPYSDYDVVTAADAPVAKWLGYSVESTYVAQWTFGPFDPDHVGKTELSPSELDALATPTSSLPVGRYGLDAVLDPGHELDIYPNGIVVLVTPNGQSRRLMPVTKAYYATDGNNNEIAVTLDVVRGEVTVRPPYGYEKKTTLRASARD